MLAFILLVAATVNAGHVMNAKPTTWTKFGDILKIGDWKFQMIPKEGDGKIQDPDTEPVPSKDPVAEPTAGFTTGKGDQGRVWVFNETHLHETKTRAEGKDNWDKFTDKVMKKSVYDELQTWQLMAIVKAAPEQVEMMEKKLYKMKQKCTRRRNVSEHFQSLTAGGFGFTGNQFSVAAEGKDNKEKAKSEGKKKGKKEKKVDKMKPAELVEKIIAYDEKLKAMEKKMKKLSKKCK